MAALKRTVTTVPPSCRGSICKSLSCALAIARAIDRSRPVPPVLRARDGSVRQKSSMPCASMPGETRPLVFDCYEGTSFPDSGRAEEALPARRIAAYIIHQDEQQLLKALRVAANGSRLQRHIETNSCLFEKRPCRLRHGRAFGSEIEWPHLRNETVGFCQRERPQVIDETRKSFHMAVRWRMACLSSGKTSSAMPCKRPCRMVSGVRSSPPWC